MELALLLLLPFAVAALGTKSGVIKQGRPCPQGCTDRGNCDVETGRCACPWGFEGPACELDRMAACRLTPDGPGSCGSLWPRHCECYRACHKLYCHNPSRPDHCTHESGGDMLQNRCWLRTDPGAPQDSGLPDDWNSGGTVWFRRFAVHEGRASYDADRDLLAPRELWGRSNWNGNHTAYPLSACPNRCTNGRGVCFKWEHWQRPACVCHKGYNGTECETADDSEACWFSPDCGGRGTCKSGFCHCQPGFWGMGCHRSVAYQPEVPPGGTWPELRTATKIKIYMYELPWDVAFPGSYNDGHFGRDPMYRAYEWFMMYFLKDTAVRTENPYEANLFYVPALLYFYIGNVRDAVPQSTWVVNYIRTHWPFWDRSGGRDHFYFMTGDRGTCHSPRSLQDTAIKVVHFGLQRANVSWPGVDNKDYGCVQVKRDLVVPPMNMFVDLLPTDTVQYYKWLVDNGGRDANRTLLFFFAGGVGEGTEYSGGTRQAIKRFLDSLQPMPSDVKFLEGRTSTYRNLLRTSKFCICPYGYGWGLRVVQAVEFGCIPIIIQDNVYQAFEDFMPYEEFSVRMPLADVPRMIDVLRSYSEEQVAAMRLGLAKYYRAFIWNREYGGQAYEWTLVGLQRKLQNMKGDFYRHRSRRRGG